ncbi:unnamed protein product [Paramecium pentaurelia]|uniref:Uncharacterized protein n=1 Tax=Paramecium pentaurelia TaxID=43138 RepID=A0A8S1VSV8_9CILI|nr:unnamed protein product [Paramecium pentaurelia]
MFALLINNLLPIQVSVFKKFHQQTNFVYEILIFFFRLFQFKVLKSFFKEFMFFHPNPILEDK